MFNDVMRRLARRLYPTGRAFRMPYDGILDRLHRALSISEAQAASDAKAILYSVLPDNDYFTVADAADWERRLGIYSSDSVPLADRKLAIIRKMNHPGTIPARQNYRYLQAQLRAAGFDVYVHENKFSSGGDFITKTPQEVAGAGPTNTAIHGSFQHGPIQHGATYNNIIANYVEQEKDETFVVTPNLRSTFFVNGDSSDLTVFAGVSAARKNEFRQLLLQLKPVQMIGYLFVNYT